LRVTEHNILVVCKYYSRIRLARLAQLLDLPPAETERHLSDMVVAGALSAKIDRPAGALHSMRSIPITKYIRECSFWTRCFLPQNSA